MKTTQQCMSGLEDILNKEIEQLRCLYACQNRMYKSVVIRDWIKLQNEIALSSSITDSFLETERKRLSLVRDIKPEADGTRDFYSVTADFPDAERTRIHALFREVKKLLLLSKSENDVLNTYVANARTVVTGLIETIIPAGRSKIYTKHGAIASAPVESMVLNRSF